MKREEKSRLTKEKLFKVAIELISEKGYENVTVSEICKKAEVAKGTFYVHFESKDDIIKANYYDDMSNYVFKKLDKYILEQYERFDFNNGVQAKDKIKQIIKLEFEYGKKVGYKIISRAFITNLTDCINERESNFERRKFSEPLKEFIDEGIKNSEFKSKEDNELFTIIDSFLRGIIFQWCLSKGDEEILDIGLKTFSEILEVL